jgi:hypothetical protein
VVRHRPRGELDPEPEPLQLGLGPGFLWIGPEYYQAFDPGLAKCGQVEGLCVADVCGGSVSLTFP